MSHPPVSDETFQCVYVPGSGAALQIVGEFYKQNNLKRLLRGGESCYAVLRPQPNNPHDSNAVAVYINNLHVGFLSKDLAAEIQGYLIALEFAGLRLCCSAMIIEPEFSPEDEDSIQVELDIEANSVMQAILRSPSASLVIESFGGVDGIHAQPKRPKRSLLMWIAKLLWRQKRRIAKFAIFALAAWLAVWLLGVIFGGVKYGWDEAVSFLKYGLDWL